MYKIFAGLVHVVVEPRTFHGSAQSLDYRRQQGVIEAPSGVLEVPGEHLPEGFWVEESDPVDALFGVPVEGLGHLVEDVHLHELVAKLVHVRLLLLQEGLGSAARELLD